MDAKNAVEKYYIVQSLPGPERPTLPEGEYKTPSLWEGRTR
jgi:hypothetical protein